MGKVLKMTVGLPRSGKSTWAKGQSDPIVNPDSIRLALHGNPFIPEAEWLVWGIAKVMVYALFLAGHNSVILDSTSTTKKRRAEWKSHHWSRVYRQIDTPVATCLRRAREANRGDLVPVIERMHENWEDIEDDEWDNIKEGFKLP